MSREIVSTDRAPLGLGVPVSQAVKVGNLVFVSGITPFTKDLQLAKGDFPAQMKRVMESTREILAAAGSSIGQIVKCTVILARRSDFHVMNEIYATYWRERQYPARTTIEARLMHPDFLVEMECVAEA
jgi:2-iminobutanoate/2-iminopropanoate deaminase